MFGLQVSVSRLRSPAHLLLACRCWLVGKKKPPPKAGAWDLLIKPGEAFIEGANEPHYVENVGGEPAIVWVTVASVEGMPTTEFIK